MAFKYLFLVTACLFSTNAQLLPIRDLASTVFQGVREAVFGGSHEEPPHTVVRQAEGYEIREYQAANWVCTTASSRPRDMFMRLFNYIQGANAQSTSIAMTVPVTRLVEEPDTERTLEMCFYIPSKFQADPPQPTEANVRVVRREAGQFAVSRFSGYASDTDWKSELSKLKAALGSEHRGGTIYFSGYNSPFELFNRRNEVWVQVNQA